MTTAIEDVRRDLRYAARTLRREPTFVAGVVLTFALAIGTNAAMFGLVTRLMLAPPPGIAAPDRVATLGLALASDDGERYTMTTTSYPAFVGLRSVDAFSSVAATRPDTVTVGRTPDLTRVAALGVTDTYFTTMRASMTIGRFLGPADNDLPVAVLSHAYWQRTTGGDRGVIGREIVINDQSFRAVGVASRGFNGHELGAVDLFVPLPALMSKTSDWATNRFMNVVSVVVRLRDGVSPVSAAQAASASLRESGSGVRTIGAELNSIVPGRNARQSAQAQIALWLAGVSIVVLLIATANVGTLLSLRAARRRREIAVRVVMGARHADLARQLLIESLMLASLGAIVGLVLSRWFADVVRVTLLPTLAPTESFVDGRVLTASVIGAMLAGVIAALAPLVQTKRTNLASQLRSGGEHGASSKLALQNALVGVQVALCTLLLIGAALFVRSLQRVQSQHLGFSTTRLLYGALEFRGYIAGAERDMAYTEAVQRVRTVPGVTAATVVQGIPFGPHAIPAISIPGFAKPPTVGGQIPILYAATPEYLKMMDVHLVSGRLISAADTRRSTLVAIVNETMARTVWPGQSALGKCIRVAYGGFASGEGTIESRPCREVVGVVTNSRARSLKPDRSEDKLMQYYLPFDQLPEFPFPDPFYVMGMMVQVNGDADRALARVQRAMQSNTALPMFAKLRPYQDLLDPQLRTWRLGATLFTAFGALALGIAVVGLFAVVSYLATQRTREMGIRLALGSTRATITRLVVSDALRMASVGIGVGVLGALGGGPVIASMLFQTSSREAASMAIASGVLLVATIVAAAVPAWRAARTDPVVALREEG